MRLAFRYDPDTRDDFIKQILNIPRKDERFIFINKNLGLSYCRTFFETMVKSVGIQSLLACPSNINKISYLFEMITEYRGYMTRFLILVMLGCGCTVWYHVVLTDNPNQDIFDVFRIISSYKPFFNPNYCIQGWNKMFFSESVEDVAANVVSAFNEEPFSEVDVPSPALSLGIVKASGLSIVIVILLTC